MTARIKFTDATHAHFREATRRYRARQRGELPPLVSSPRPSPPDGLWSDLVPYVCLDCHKTHLTRRERIRADGNRCKSCTVVRRNKGPRSEQWVKKLGDARRGKSAPWNKNLWQRMTPEQHAKRLAALRNLPDGKRGGAAKKRIDPALRALRHKVHGCCAQMVRRIIRLKRACKKTFRTFEYLGYTRADFIAHIERQFQSGMSWDNWGEWHIDHIKPISAWVREGVTDVRTINALSNLQPLWAAENLRKSRYVSHRNGVPTKAHLSAVLKGTAA